MPIHHHHHHGSGKHHQCKVGSLFQLPNLPIDLTCVKGCFDKCLNHYGTTNCVITLLGLILLACLVGKPICHFAVVLIVLAGAFVLVIILAILSAPVVLLCSLVSLTFSLIYYLFAVMCFVFKHFITINCDFPCSGVTTKLRCPPGEDPNDSERTTFWPFSKKESCFPSNGYPNGDCPNHSNYPSGRQDYPDPRYQQNNGHNGYPLEGRSEYPLDAPSQLNDPNSGSGRVYRLRSREVNCDQPNGSRDRQLDRPISRHQSREVINHSNRDVSRHHSREVIRRGSRDNANCGAQLDIQISRGKGSRQNLSASRRGSHSSSPLPDVCIVADNQPNNSEFAEVKLSGRHRTGSKGSVNWKPTSGSHNSSGKGGSRKQGSGQYPEYIEAKNVQLSVANLNLDIAKTGQNSTGVISCNQRPREERYIIVSHRPISPEVDCTVTTEEYEY